MDVDGVAAGTGIVAAAATAALAAAPYLLLDPTAVGAYVTAGPGGLRLIALFGLVAIVVLAAGAAGRSDPAQMAGAAVVLGAASALLAWWWALSVPAALVGSLTDAASFAYHRWALALAATALLAAAGAYARSVL